MITWNEFDGPTLGGDTWPVFRVDIRCLPMANMFKNLHLTAHETELIVNNMLFDLEDRMYEYMTDWVNEVRS